MAHEAISIHAPREGSDVDSSTSGTSPFPFLSTLPARGATACVWLISLDFVISIHAPREGSDGRSGCLARLARRISIHAPREGSDLTAAESKHWKSVFLSTLPARGATHPRRHQRGLCAISIHAPREGSDGHPRRHQRGLCAISIHAPREGSDGLLLGTGHFSRIISIHAPREGSDASGRGPAPASAAYFYPRSPRGERPDY